MPRGDKKPVKSNKEATVGDRTTIYMDPKTRTNREGIATLVSIVADYGGGDVHWMVNFDGHPPNEQHRRAIYTGTAVDEG